MKADQIHLVVSVILLLLSCNGRNTRETLSTTKPEITSLEIEYATGFRVSSVGNALQVDVTYPFQGATSGYRYLLVPKGGSVPEHDADTRVIFTPVDRIVCTSTTHIPLLDYLGVSDRLVGFPNTDLISSEKMRARIDSGSIQELGIEEQLNVERVAVLKPDLVMGYTMTGDYGQFKKMEELGMSVVLNAEYLEKHPLGRAEWIKFMALFFNKEKEADSVFNIIEKNYEDTKSLASQSSNHPSVISGIVYGDAWFMPGGENYASKILKDAGCNYLWGEDTSHGFLQLSFESVYERAHDADLWIGVATMKTLKELQDTDHRYTRFKPFREKQVYTYNARLGAKGGSEFLELGYLRPDIILKDLVKIAHPELLPDYKLYFHKRLN